MNSRGARTIWGSILRKNRREKRCQLDAQRRNISRYAKIGVKGRLTGNEFVQQWSSVGPRSTSKLARFGAVWAKFLWGFGGGGHGVFKGQDFLGKEATGK